MRTLTLIVALVTVAALAGCGKKPDPTTAPGTPAPGPAPGAPASDKDRFQGVWKEESVDAGGGAKEPKGRGARLQVEGDRVALRESATDPGEPFTGTWDETKTPKVLSLAPTGRPAGAAQVWIYKFEGDALTVAFSAFDGTPTDFKGDVKTGTVVIRFTKTDEKPVAQGPKGPPTTRK